MSLSFTGFVELLRVGVFIRVEICPALQLVLELLISEFFFRADSIGLWNALFVIVGF